MLSWSEPNDPEDWSLDHIGSVSFLSAVERFPGLEFFTGLVGRITARVLIDYIEVNGSPDGAQEWFDREITSVAVAAAVIGFLHQDVNWGKTDGDPTYFPRPAAYHRSATGGSRRKDRKGRLG